MAGKDYYSTLGVSRKASEREIKQAFRKLARQYHPDVNSGDKSAEGKFKEISGAYEVLSDKEKRKNYDEFGDQWQHADQFRQAQRQQQQAPSWGSTGGKVRFSFGDEDLSSIFGDLFGNVGGATFSRRVSPRRGRDLEHPVEVALEEAYQGAARTISFDNGKRGEVKIPAGVKDGFRVRIAGKGEPGFSGGAAGDLYLLVSVKRHAKIQRKGDNLQVEVPVPLTVAVLGGEVQVDTLNGKVMLKIPPETQNGNTFRLAGKGMPRLRGSSHGDLLAKVKVVLPTKLSAQEKELFQRLRELRSSE